MSVGKRRKSVASNKNQRTQSFGRDQPLQSQRLRGSSKLPRWFSASLDVIARQRATKEPLENVVQKTCRTYHLGSKERKQVGDACFAFARASSSVESAWEANHRTHGGRIPDRRTRDHIGLLLVQLWQGNSVESWPMPPEALLHLLEEPRPEEILSLPPWMVKRLNKVYQAEASELLHALHKPAPFVIATDPQFINADDLVEACQQHDCGITPSPIAPHAFRCDRRFSLQRLPRELRQHVWPMDDGSQLIARTLGVQSDDEVLDLCAGGGGKSRILSSLSSSVTALDLSARRLSSCDSLPLKTKVVADGRQPPFPPNTFDRVLVDAPCSGSGTIRRAPDVGARIEEESIASFQSLQVELMRAAIEVTKPGGRLIYATCSLFAEENEEVVQQILSEHHTIKELPLADAWDFSPRPQLLGNESHFTLLPSKHGTDGFFLATFVKVAK